MLVKDAVALTPANWIKTRPAARQTIESQVA